MSKAGKRVAVVGATVAITLGAAGANAAGEGKNVLAGTEGAAGLSAAVVAAMANTKKR